MSANRYGSNSGHGHVWARPDGVKARCGGPAMCRQCAADLTQATNPALPNESSLAASADLRETYARIIALHGLGTESGISHRGPPNTSWTVEEWENRVLQCVPERVERQCYELADALLANPLPGRREGGSK